MVRKSTASKTPDPKAAPARQGSQLLNEVAGVVCVLVAIIAVISFFSYEPDQVARNFGGPIGYGLSMVFMQTLGLAAYALPLVLAALGIRLIHSGLSDLSLARGAAVLTVVLASSVLLGLFFDHRPIVSGGGWFGGFTATVLRETCGPAGAFVVASGLVLLAAMFLSGTSLRAGAGQLATRLGNARRNWRERGVQHRDNVIVLKDVVNRKREEAATAAKRVGPVIVLKEPAAVDPAKKSKRSGTQEVMRFASASGYITPPLSKLDTPRQIGAPVDEDALRKSSEVLEAKLANFDIEGHVEAVRPGPVITTF